MIRNLQIRGQYDIGSVNNLTNNLDVETLWKWHRNCQFHIQDGVQQSVPFFDTPHFFGLDLGWREGGAREERALDQWQLVVSIFLIHKYIQVRLYFRTSLMCETILAYVFSHLDHSSYFIISFAVSLYRDELRYN